MDTIIADTFQHPKIASSRIKQVLVALIICVILYLLISSALTSYVRLIKKYELFTAGTTGVYNAPVVQAGEVIFAANSYKVDIDRDVKTALAHTPPASINWMEIVTFDQQYKSAPIIQLNVIGIQLLTKANFKELSNAASVATNPTEKSFNYNLQAIDVTATGFKCAIDMSYSLYPNYIKIQWAAIGFAKTPINNIVYGTTSGITKLDTTGANRISGTTTLTISQSDLANRSISEKAGFITHRKAFVSPISYRINTAIMTPIILMSVIPEFWNTPFPTNLSFSINAGEVSNVSASTSTAVATSKFNINMNMFRAIVLTDSGPTLTMGLSWLIVHGV